MDSDVEKSLPSQPPTTEEKGKEKKEEKKEKKTKKDKEEEETDEAGDEVKKTSESEDEDRDEVLEESPCGRWQKRREQVRQRDVPGIDAAFLAMDTETGNEVVWNEVQFSERKNFREQEDKIRQVFDNLRSLGHCNLVKFYKWWTDERKKDKPRIIFITEYMSSGNMSQFLKRTRKGTKVMNEKSWRKWSTQILSALSYLHTSQPPIIHGNLSCNTIFIQQNGLIKIGCVAPNAIHHHVKTFRDSLKAMHYMAPEYDNEEAVTTAADIYSFGVCILEMAVLGFINGDSAAKESLMSGPVLSQANLAAQATGPQSATSVSSATSPDPSATPKAPPFVITKDYLQKKLALLEDSPRQQDLIQRCLEEDPSKRPTARELLFHDVLFEVHSLKLLAAHTIVSGKKRYEGSETGGEGGEEEKKRSQYLHISEVSESLLEDHIRAISGDSEEDKERVVAEIRFRQHQEPIQIKYSQVPLLELDKFLEDVKNGIYPLTAFASVPIKAPPIPQTGKKTESENVSEEGERDEGEKDKGLEGGRKDSILRREPSKNGKEEREEKEEKKAETEDRGDSKEESKEEPQPEKPLEDRRVIGASGEFLSDPSGSDSGTLKGKLRLHLLLDDQMNRELSAPIAETDTPQLLIKELVNFGLINEDDSSLILQVVLHALENPSPLPPQVPLLPLNVPQPLNITPRPTTPQ